MVIEIGSLFIVVVGVQIDIVVDLELALVVVSNVWVIFAVVTYDVVVNIIKVVVLVVVILVLVSVEISKRLLVLPPMQFSFIKDSSIVLFLVLVCRRGGIPPKFRG